MNNTEFNEINSYLRIFIECGYNVTYNNNIIIQYNNIDMFMIAKNWYSGYLLVKSDFRTKDSKVFTGFYTCESLILEKLSLSEVKKVANERIKDLKSFKTKLKIRNLEKDFKSAI